MKVKEIIYFNNKMEKVNKSQAYIAKIIYENGNIIFAFPEK